MEPGSEPLATHLSRMMKSDLVSALSFSPGDLTEYFAVRKCVATLLLTGSTVEEIQLLTAHRLSRGQILKCVYRMVADDVVSLIPLVSEEEFITQGPSWMTQQAGTNCLH